VRTSTTTGRRLGRLGRLSWPLVALLLLLLALLVAALADSVGGPSPGDPRPATGSACGCSVAPVPAPDVFGGMITGVPSARSGGTDTTTAKDA
jgi:eukaryotic-like serine/threonine-protein kinase